MAAYQYFFLPQNLKKITAENCLALIEMKKKELQLLREKINGQLVKDEKLIQKQTKAGLTKPADLTLLEQSKKNRLEAYNLILQLQDKILSNHILSAPWFPDVSKTKTTQFLSQTEINNFLDVITILSLSIEISEILHGALDEKNFSHQQDELSEIIEHFAMKVYSLPKNSNDFLNKISTELMHLAIACICLGTCFFLFATISHFALIATTVFVCTGLSFIGISGYIQFINQKTELVSLLIEIINYFKHQNLKFNFDSISEEEGRYSRSYSTDSSELRYRILDFSSIYQNLEEESLTNSENFLQLAILALRRNKTTVEDQDRRSISSPTNSLRSVDKSSDHSAEISVEEQDGRSISSPTNSLKSVDKSSEHSAEISYGPKTSTLYYQDCYDTSDTSIENSLAGNNQNNNFKDGWQIVRRPQRTSDIKSTLFHKNPMRDRHSDDDEEEKEYYKVK